MAFEGVAGKLQAVFNKLSGRGKLSEKDVREAMREIKLALLEADVSFVVVKSFINSVTQRAVGAEVLESLTPGQQVIKIVNEELTALMGGTNAKLDFGSRKPSVILMAGLQGAGKTTACGKLAAYIKKQYGKSVMLAACDVYRPAAIDQLRIIGEKVGAAVFDEGQGNPVDIALHAIERAKHDFCDVLIVDTAGRLHVDVDMMTEIAAISAAVQPAEILLVLDAMTGQDAVNAAKSFNDALELTGVILTKLDGDTRGGAALSVRSVTGKPIKFAGVGEKLNELEVFHPDRMASRILGMGDVLTLIEKAQSNFDDKKARELEAKLRNDAFTLDDFLEQFQQLRNMGSLDELVGMLGINPVQLQGAQVDEKLMSRYEAIIRSMTPSERVKPAILNASRRRRIAAGSGTTVQEVNKLLKQYNQTRDMMKQFSGKSQKRFGRKMKLPFGFN
ncbi:MAG: signal recognition particle protein [Clostridia bacterium]|nr:signal recognition particle protein [Clostridia bacterium]